MNPMDNYTTMYMIQGVYMNPMDDYATINISRVCI